MTQTAEQALKDAALYTDEVEYALVKLPPQAIVIAAGALAELGEPFSTVIADKDEVTMFIPAAAADDFAERLVGHELADTRYRLLTFDLELEPDLVGFMALVSRVLADAGISIIPIGAFSRDHLFIPADQFDNAVAALESARG